MRDTTNAFQQAQLSEQRFSMLIKVCIIGKKTSKRSNSTFFRFEAIASFPVSTQPCTMSLFSFLVDPF